MLPQPDPHVLSVNPKFALLWQDLERTKLQGNGRSAGVVAGKGGRGDEVGRANGRTEGQGKAEKKVEQKGFKEALHDARVEEAKKEILRDVLGLVGYKVGGLPDELQQVVQIVSAQLEGRILDVDSDVVEGEVEYFLEQINQITPPINTHIEETAALLSSILNPTNLPPSPSDGILALQTSISTAQTTLSRTRAALAAQTASLLTQYSTLFAQCIRLLEQILHGSVTRHTRARATYLALFAQGVEKKLLLLKAQVQAQVYDRETKVILEKKMEDVEGEIRRVGREGRYREGVLGELERQGRGLEKCAEDVRGVRGEMRRVREEIARVEGAL